MEIFQLLMPIFTEYGYIALFVMLLVCGFGVPVPEDVTLVTGGVIAGLGYANPHTMFAVGMAGVLVGDGLIFLLGRFTVNGLRVCLGSHAFSPKNALPKPKMPFSVMGVG